MAANKAGKKYSFVLVHGGWGSAFVFSQLREMLIARGHRVCTPTLTGVGSRSHLLGEDTTLAVHIQDVVSDLKWADLSNVVLVGHSYGGMVITGVADQVPELIDSIVYLDAFLPADGQSVMDLAIIPEAVEQFQAARASGDLAIPFPQEFASTLGIPKDILWKFTPHPLATLFDPIRLTGKHESIRKKTFVRAAQWPDHEQVVARLEKNPAWNTISLSTGHMLQWEAPERCVAILETAAE